MKKSLSAIAGLAIALCAPSLQAQVNRGTLVELGIDAGVAFGLDDPQTTVISVPSQDFRIGLFLSDNIEVEPRVALSSVHSSGNGSATIYNFELGILMQPGSNPVGTGLYVRPFGGVTGASVSGGGSASSGYAGGGLGVKIPFAERLATRLEINYLHSFGDNAGNEIGALIGLSFFTR